MGGRGDRDALLSEAAERFGTPLYVYFTDAIAERAAALRQAFGGRFALSYAVKANPNPTLLAWLGGHVAYLDVSSIGELRRAREAGWDPARASFTGPGKRGFEIEEAIASGIGELVVESVQEACTASRIAGNLGKVQDVLIRIAPDQVPRGFGDQMAGRPSPFGIDMETTATELPKILGLPHLNVTGFHIYSGTQCLRAEAICANYRTFIAIFRDLCERYDIAPRKLVFGSGLGIPYHDEDVPLDLAAVAGDIAAELDALSREPRFAHAELVLELGRYLVGEAGYFVTRVIAIKHSRGAKIAICDGGMNNHLPASGHFGMVIRRAYSMHKVHGGPSVEKVDIVGPLCTSIDRLGSGVLLPETNEGDLIAIHNSGAYGLTASPIHFISHARPEEVLVEGTALRAASASGAASEAASRHAPSPLAPAAPA